MMSYYYFDVLQFIDDQGLIEKWCSHFSIYYSKINIFTVNVYCLAIV